MPSQIVVDILIVGLPLVTAGGVFALTAAGAYLTSKYKDTKLGQALVVLDRVVIDVVKELNQTIVDDLKKARADGKLTPDETEQIKNKAIDLVLKRLGSGVIKVLQSIFGSLVGLVSTKVEATLYDLKMAQK